MVFGSTLPPGGEPLMASAQLRMTAMPVTSIYGRRILKKTGRHNFHKGVDTSNGTKYPHSAFGDGVVVESPQKSRHREFGWYIRIRHATGIETSHHSLDGPALFKVGADVEMGDVVGRAGASALAATGKHIHNGLWLAGKHVDPLKFLTPGKAVKVSLNESVPARAATPFAVPIFAPAGVDMFIAVRHGSFFLAVPRAGAITLVSLGRNDLTENMPIVRFVSDPSWKAFLACVTNPGVAA